jgi:hypothetical protein
MTMSGEARRLSREAPEKNAEATFLVPLLVLAGTGTGTGRAIGCSVTLSSRAGHRRGVVVGDRRAWRRCRRHGDDSRGR